MSKKHICKSKFHVRYHFLDISGEKTLLTFPAPSIRVRLVFLKYCHENLSSPNLMLREYR